MTLQYAIEEVLDHFPDLGSTLIIAELNKAYARFCSMSRVYKASYNLSPLTAVSYALASDVDEVYRVDYFDTAGQIIDPENPTYVIEGGYIKFYDYLGDTLTTWPTNITTCTLRYFKIPAALSTLSSSFAIDSESHEYIVAGALSKLYARYPVDIVTQNGAAKGKDWNASRHYQGEFMFGVTEAKKKSNKDKDASIFNVALMNFDSENYT